MSTNHATVATHSHSLPSFNQAFSNRSLNNIPTVNTLPPIQSRIPSDSYRVDSPGSTPRSRPSSHERSESKPSTRKRTHENITSSSRDESDDEQRASPHLTQIKQEQDHDMLEPSSPPLPSSDKQSDHNRIPTDSTDSPHSPSTVASPLKKRRVTISGAPHLNTNIRPPPVDQTNSTPISPAVVGFTVNRDNPAAVGQLRNAISVKQKQQALIEQRRGSLAGGPAPATPLNSNHPPPSSSEERISVPTAKTSGPPRSNRRSPNMATTARRVPPSAPPTGTTRPPSPCPVLVPAQPQLHPSEQQRQQQHPLMPAPTQTLPPPPISFARRRAGLLGAAGKRKPADILISPREAQSFDQFQPSIQSAPPIPHAGQGAFQSGRLAMALPRLPPVMSASDNVRRVASNVPPTPTRLSLLRPPATATAATTNTTTTTVTTTPMISVSGRSPPGANVPIASTLVPPTPASLHHPGYSGDKSAFLAPFEIFYDALNDSKQLKIWLSEQLQRSNALEQSLSQQQDKFNDIIESTVEKRVSGMRAEMLGLRRRIEDLEDALRNATSDHHRRHSIDMTGSSGGGPLPKGKQPLRNGTNLGPSESYTFPPPLPQQQQQHEHSRHRPDPTRRIPSPSWAQERDIRGNPLHPPHPHPLPQHSGGDNNSDRHASSPTPYDSPRRLASISATRLDPPRSRDVGGELSLHHPRPGVVGLPSPPQAYRDHPSDRNLPPIKDSHGRPTATAAAAAASRNERERERERDSQQRPPLTRQLSQHTTDGNGSPNAPPPPPTPTSASSHSAGAQQQQSSRRSGSRRNSVAMSPPDGHGGESS